LSVKVTRDRVLSLSGSMVIVSCGRIWPSMPWAAQARGIIARDLLDYPALGAADPSGRCERCEL
jgi:hypothetical protein